MLLSSWAAIMTRCQRTPREWFVEAARCYVEQHQGCAWCGESYCVYRNERRNQLEYCCNSCDFRTAHNITENNYVSYPGEDPANKRAIVYDI
jgi:hypothetical protein